MKFVINFFLGIIFGFGLIISNIFNPKNLTLFLPTGPEWNSSILLTVGSIITFSTVFFFLIRKKSLIINKHFSVNQRSYLDSYNLIGSILFGIGWGLSGFCVSTATINLAFNNLESLLFFIFMLLGFYAPQFFRKIIL